jgi:hypothetical protein
VLLHLRDDLRIGRLVRGLDCNNTLRQRPSADFFTTEVWTWRGLVTYDTAFVIDLASRRVRIVGSTPRPNEVFMRQVGRTLTAATGRLRSSTGAKRDERRGPKLIARQTPEEKEGRSSGSAYNRRLSPLGSPMVIATGTRLDPYEILSAVGAGGMGEVYLARDTRLNRPVAIKSLSAEIADAASLGRFQ